jgi:hypothetical protein
MKEKLLKLMIFIFTYLQLTYFETLKLIHLKLKTVENIE